MQSLKLLEYAQKNVMDSIFNKAADAQDCYKTIFYIYT